MELPVAQRRALLSSRNGYSYLPALLSFAIGVTITAVICILIVRLQQARIQDAFQRDTGRVTALTETRLLAHFETLLAVKGLFAAGDTIDRSQFKRFLDQLDLRTNHPGFQAIQFVRSVPGPERAQFVASVRRDASVQRGGYPHFNIRPDVPRPQHYVIEITEPLEGNEAAFGLDLASLPSHLEALELGRDSGKPVATEPVKLVQDPSGQAGFVMRAPLFRFGMPVVTPAERRAALVGFAAIVYRVNDLMREVVEPQLIPHMRIAIYDTGYASQSAPAQRKTGALMFDSRQAYHEVAPSRTELSAYQARHTLAVGQRRWELHFIARDGTRYGWTLAPAAGAALSGTIISALIASLVTALGRRRALSAQLQSSLEEQHAILDNATVGIELIKERRIASCNQGMAKMLGYETGELIGSSTRIKFASDQAFDSIGEAAYGVMAAGGSWIGEVEWLRKDGSTVWCRLHGKLIAPSTPDKGSIWVSYDVTAQRLADAAIKQANSGLARSLAQVEQTYLDVTHLSELSSYLQACPDIDDAFACICALAPRVFAHGGGALYMMDADRATLHERARWGKVLADKPSFSTMECWALRRGQPYRVDQDPGALCCPHFGVGGGAAPPARVCLPLFAQATIFGLLVLEHGHHDDGAGVELRYRLGVAMAEHIGLALANMQLRDTLRQQSIRDPLTGLYNRRHMDEVIRHELARAERRGATLAIAMVDVDHFKQFNDRHGHDAGDAVLQGVAATISGLVRESDIACRFGGEEFVIVLCDIGVEQAVERCDTIRHAIARMDLQHAGKPVGRITASFGLAYYPAHGNDVARLVKCADQALYQAKEGGRDRVVCCA